MAKKKNNQYKDKASPAANFLYVIAVIVLIVLLVFMYRIRQTRRAAFEESRRQVAAEETLKALEPRAQGQEEESIVESILS